MIAAVLAPALVLVAAVLAAHALTRTRKAPAMNLDRITAPPAAPSPTNLPDGHDDPASLRYVPDALRQWWDDTPLDRLALREAVERHARRARIDVARHNDPARFTAAMLAERIDLAAAPLSAVEDALYGRATQQLPPLTAEGEERALHLDRLARASAAARAAAEEEASAALREAYRCRACSSPKPTISAPLCPACEPVAVALRVELARADVLGDGRTRGDAVAAYLARRG